MPWQKSGKTSFSAFMSGSLVDTIRQERALTDAVDINPRVARYRLAADRGDAQAMFELGKLLANGDDGVAKDVPAAARLYRQAADLGDVDAMDNLGVLLVSGEDGIAKDVPAAVGLLRQAAELGEAGAMVNLGVLLESGEDSIAKDVPAAARLYRQAADFGDADAMFNLGVLLESGEDGIAKDVPAAARVYRQATDLGEACAMNNLGLLLESGKDGVAKDESAAAGLHRQAADSGSTVGRNNLERLLQSIEVQSGSKLLNEAADRDRKEATQALDKFSISGESVGNRVPNLPLDEPRTRDAHADSVAMQGIGDSNRRKYDVFISHAGPDKLGMAEPIYKALTLHNVHTFLDMEDLQINDCTGPEAMELAMGEAHVGIFVLSPEFASRKWTLRELRHFLERDEKCRADRRPRPVVLPVFFRLSLRECTRADAEIYGETSRHRDMLNENGFSRAERQGECSAVAAEALKGVTRYSGVEVSRIGGGKGLSTLDIECCSDG